MVNLRSSSVKAPRGPTGPPSQSPNTASGDTYQPDAEYYYSDSEMTNSDGTVMVEAVYNYEQSTAQNTLSITLGGVTLSYDLNNPDAWPVSDTDEQRVESWASTDDAALVEDTSTAIVSQGAQQADPHNLLNYYAVAMLVDFSPPTASGARVNKRRDALHHAISSLQMKLVNSACTQTGAGSVPPQSCFGCCGIRCACISGLNGAAIYTSACAAHDQCTGQYGYRGSITHCKAAFARAVASMWSYFQLY